MSDGYLRNPTMGEEFRRIRKDNEKTLRDIAEASGYSLSYISDIERNNRSFPDGEPGRKIIVALDPSKDQLRWLAWVQLIYAIAPVKEVYNLKLQDVAKLLNGQPPTKGAGM